MSAPQPPQTPEARALALARVLCGVVVLLAVGHFLAPHLPAVIAERIHLNTEASIPAWLSSSLLLGVSLCSARLWFGSPVGARRHWAWLAAGYLFLSADETGRLHELVDVLTPVKWVFVYAPVALGVFVLVCRGLAAEPGADSRWIIGGIVVFGIGGVGCEALSAWLHPLPPLWQEIEYAVEESLEMLGTIGVLTGCLSKCLRRSAAAQAEASSIAR